MGCNRILCANGRQYKYLMMFLSSFLMKLVFKVDDPSKKHFDEAVASIEKRVAALGAAAAATATGIGFAVKKISENLGELWYAAQAV